MPPIWGWDSETVPLDIIVFSKDRACQLDALLRSMREFFELPHRLHVLYTTSNHEFELGYDLLRLWHKGVHWVCDEYDFGRALRQLTSDIDHGPGRYLMFMVDDMIFTRTFTAGKLMQSLDADEDLLGVSLRLGENITYCYVRDIKTTPPDFSKEHRWVWKTASSGYWNYPMALDAHIFRTPDFVKLLPRLRFINPSSLEAKLAGQPFPRPDMACESTPSVINIAANRVQSTYRNRCGDTSAGFLNESFLQGFAIDVVPFTQKSYNSCHIDEDFTLVDDHRSRSPGGIERFSRGGREYVRVDLRKIPTFILNCKDDTSKRLLIQEQLTELRLNFEFISTLRVKPGWVGVALGHMKTLRLSRARPPFLVLEDDCVFTQNFQPVVEIPAEAEALYLGASIFGIETPGKMSWGKANKVRWERYDEGYLRVYNMLARHAVLYLDEVFQAVVIESQAEALTNRHLPHMGDIGLAMLQPSHTTLVLEHNVCRQLNRDATNRDLAASQPDNEIKPTDRELIRPTGVVAPKTSKTGWFGGGCLVSHKYKFIYFYIGKNASSAIRSELGKPRYQCELSSITDLDKHVLNDYFEFTFLRDPVSRFVSTYQELSIRGGVNDSTVVKKPFMGLEDGAERFEAFITQVEKEKWDPLVHTQGDLISQTQMDFYGRVESVTTDLKLLFKRLGIEDCPELPVRRSRVGRKNHHGYNRFNIDHNQLPQEQIDRIRELYREDVDLIQAFCPKPPMHHGDSIIKSSSYALALRFELNETLEPVELFSRVNSEHQSCMVHCMGDRGFYAEVTTLARAMIYAWEHGLQLLLDSSGSRWAYDKGWADYFQPFCLEANQVEADRIVERIEYPLNGDKSDFLRLLRFAPKKLLFGQSHLRGFQKILAFFTAMIFKPTPESQLVIDQLTKSLNLPRDYDAIHVRRGDRVGNGDVFYPVAKYLKQLEPVPAGRTLFVMSDSFEALQEVFEYIHAQGALIHVVTLIESNQIGFSESKFRRGEPFFSEEPSKMDGRPHRQYVRDKTRKLIAETMIAAGAKRFVSTFASSVGQTISYLHPDREACTLIRRPSPAQLESGSFAGHTPLAPARYHWASTTLRTDLRRRRDQYIRSNKAFKVGVVYSLSGANLLEVFSGLARAMVYAFARQRQLLLYPDSLILKGIGHWHEVIQPLAPELDVARSVRIEEKLSLDDTEGYRKLAGFKPDKLIFGSTTLEGFHQILGFFMQMLLWPAGGRQQRLAQLLEQLPLSDDFAAIHFEPTQIGSDGDTSELLQACLDPLIPLPDDQTLCVISGDDEVFSEAGKRLAASACKARAVNLRLPGEVDPSEKTDRTLAELTIALRARNFVSSSNLPLGQAAWLMHPRRKWCHLIPSDRNKTTMVNRDMYCTQLQLRHGELLQFQIHADFTHLPRLQRIAANGPLSGDSNDVGLIQLPLNKGETALAFSSRDVTYLHLIQVTVPDPALDMLLPERPGEVQKKSAEETKNHHADDAVLQEQLKHVPPCMNIEEGHLGGYIRSSHPYSNHLGWAHGDPATFNPELWLWAHETLGLNSVLDVGCGEGHAARWFHEQGCTVLGVDGSEQAERDSAIPDHHHRHDFNDGPYIPDGSWDMIWCCEFVEHVEERYAHNFLTTFSCARKYILMTYAKPGQPGWHHVNCQPEQYWVNKLERLGFRLSQKLTDQARELAGRSHFGKRGLLFVRVDEKRLPPPRSIRTKNEVVAASAASRAIPVNSMLITQLNQHKFYLFLDIFVHPERKKITAVMPWYSKDWVPAEHGIDFEAVDLIYRGQRIRGTYLPHRLDSFEPCALLDFEHPLLEKWLKKSKTISFRIEIGPHAKKFSLDTAAPPAWNVMMSLVIKNENRWVRHFLEYYLECLQVDHVLVYDNHTKDRQQLLKILKPYREAGKVSYIPWDFRWRNTDKLRKMTAQPQQEAHSLNRFANSGWIGFLDVDEFLRIPDQTLPEFLEPFRAANVDGLSFGLRWFQYKGALDFDEIIDAPLTFRESYRSRLGRKRQKLLVSPQQARFLRLHSLEDGGRELQVDDTDIYFHHYCQRDYRFKQLEGKTTRTDNYMLRHSGHLAIDGGSQIGRQKPVTNEQWIRHITRAIAEAECSRSSLNDKALSVGGMCGVLTRHFYNNVCNFKGCRYLEIGSYHGASVIAAMSGHEMDITCIENFLQFEAKQKTFENNVKPFMGKNRLRLINQDCFGLDTSDMGPFDIYLYDGGHRYNSHYNAIQNFIGTLAPLAVVIIDDWNWADVQKGTEDALRDLNVQVLYRKEIIISEVNENTEDKHMPDMDGWWNGICIMLLGQEPASD